MSYSEARFDHFPTSGWFWRDHNIAVPNLKKKYEGIVIRLGKSETKVETLCKQQLTPQEQSIETVSPQKPLREEANLSKKARQWRKYCANES
jgi:hypothetical protein